MNAAATTDETFLLPKMALLFSFCFYYSFTAISLGWLHRLVAFSLSLAFLYDFVVIIDVSETTFRLKWGANPSFTNKKPPIITILKANMMVIKYNF